MNKNEKSCTATLIITSSFLGLLAQEPYSPFANGFTVVLRVEGLLLFIDNDGNLLETRLDSDVHDIGSNDRFGRKQQTQGANDYTEYQIF